MQISNPVLRAQAALSGTVQQQHCTYNVIILIDMTELISSEHLLLLSMTALNRP